MVANITAYIALHADLHFRTSLLESVKGYAKSEKNVYYNTEDCFI